MLIELESGISSLARHVLYRMARDITDTLPRGSLLIIAPHPDDETLGCGVAIMHARARGQAVRVVIVTDGQASCRAEGLASDALVTLRESEALLACERLGVANGDVAFLKFPDGEAATHFETATRRLYEVIQEFSPAGVLYPSGMDSHLDHRAVAAMVEQLVREGVVACPAYGYPVWFWKLRTWLNPGQIARLFSGAKLVRVSTARFVERKRLALAAHRSQLENVTGASDWEGLRPSFLRHFLGPYELFFETGVRPQAMVEP